MSRRTKMFAERSSASCGPCLRCWEPRVFTLSMWLPLFPSSGGRSAWRVRTHCPVTAGYSGNYHRMSARQSSITADNSHLAIGLLGSSGWYAGGIARGTGRGVYGGSPLNLLFLAEGMLTGCGCTCVTWRGRELCRRTGGSYTSSSSGLNRRSPFRRRLLGSCALSEQRQQKLSARARSK